MKKYFKSFAISVLILAAIASFCSFGGSVKGKWQDDGIKKSTLTFEKNTFTKNTYILLIPVIYQGTYTASKGMLSMTYEKISVDGGKNWLIVSDYDPAFETTKQVAYTIDKDGNLMLGDQLWTKAK